MSVYFVNSNTSNFIISCIIFANSLYRKFTKGDAFVGFHEDSIAAVVLQVCNELLDDGSKLSDEERQPWEEKVITIPFSIAGFLGLIL